MTLPRLFLLLGAIAFAILPATNTVLAHEDDHDCEHEEHCDDHHENEHDPVLTRVCHFQPDALIGTAIEITVNEVEHHQGHEGDCRDFQVRLDGSHDCRCTPS